MSRPGGEHPDTGAMVHRAPKSVYVMLAVATGITCVRDLGFGYAIGAALGWFLTLITLGMALMHQWDTCTVCDGPPSRTATPEARARLARRVHRRWLNRTKFLLALGLVVAAVAPKPYLEGGPWWVRLVEAAVILGVLVPLVSVFLATSMHDWDKSECHNEKCRAGDKAVRKSKVKHGRRVFTHYAVWVLPVMIPVTFTIGVLALKGGPMEWLYAEALLITGLLLLLSVIHGEITCLACVKRLPHNGGELAERRMRWLRAWHQLRYTLPSSAMSLWVISWALAGTVPGRTFVTVAGVMVTVYVILNRLHGRVKPWCPWCRNGGEGAGETAPDPSSNVPVPA